MAKVGTYQCFAWWHAGLHSSRSRGKDGQVTAWNLGKRHAVSQDRDVWLVLMPCFSQCNSTPPAPHPPSAPTHAHTHWGSPSCLHGHLWCVQGGVQALFVGVTPRLLQTMPSTMVYWFAVEGTRRALMRYVDVGEAAGEAASPALGQEQPQPGQAAAALQPAA